MMNNNIDQTELIEANICESLKVGYIKLMPELRLEVEHNAIVNHPRIQGCISLLKRGVGDLPFHGYDSLEAINKVFSEHFLDLGNDYFQQCVDQLCEIVNTDQLYYGIGKVGQILDDYQLGGSKIIRAASLARSTKMEKEIQSEISEAVEKFEQIKNIQEKQEILERDQEKWFIKKPLIPSYYHLQLLAYTKSWRSGEKLAHVSRGIAKLIRLHIPSVYLRHKSQTIAPANIHLTQIEEPSRAGEYLAWFDKTKLLLMAGYRDDQFLAGVRNFIQSFSIQMIKSSYYFMKWGAYSGLALEPNWRSRTRKRLDLLYRIKEIESLMAKPYNPALT